MKNFFSQIKLIQVAFILVALAVLGVLIYLWIEKRKEKEEEESMIALGKDPALSGSPVDGASEIINAIEKSKLANAKAALKNFHPAPIADKIWNAMGTVNDDENSVYGAFGQLKNKLELAELNIYFKGLYNISLYDYLQKYMNAEELTKVYNIVSKLKAY